MAGLTAPPLAKATLDSLTAELVRKGFKDAIEKLPPLSDIVIQPQTCCESEHPYKIYIGAEKKCNGADVWAVVQGKPSTMDTKSTAPSIAFSKGDTSADILPRGYFYNLDTVELVEPFTSLWDKTAYLIQPDVPMKGYAWDRRRGWFKGLVYWYFLNDAAGRGGTLRFPNTMRGYVSQALQALGRHGRTAQQSSATGDVMGDATGDVMRDATGDVVVAAMPEQQAALVDQQTGVERGLHEERNTCQEGKQQAENQSLEDEEEVRTNAQIAMLEKKLRELRKGTTNRDSSFRPPTPYVATDPAITELSAISNHSLEARPNLVTPNKEPQRRHIEDSYASVGGVPPLTKKRKAAPAVEFPNPSNSPTQTSTSPLTACRMANAIDPKDEQLQSDSGEKLLQHFQAASHNTPAEPDRSTPTVPNPSRNPSAPNPPPSPLSTAPPPPRSPQPNLLPRPYTSAALIAGMKTALANAEILDSQLALIENEDRRLRKALQRVEQERKEVHEARSVNCAMIKGIAEGFAGGEMGKVGGAGDGTLEGGCGWGE